MERSKCRWRQLGPAGHISHIGSLLAGRSRDTQGHSHVTRFARYLEVTLDSNSNLHASSSQQHMRQEPKAGNRAGRTAERWPFAVTKKNSLHIGHDQILSSTSKLGCASGTEQCSLIPGLGQWWPTHDHCGMTACCTAKKHTAQRKKTCCTKKKQGAGFNS